MRQAKGKKEGAYGDSTGAKTRELLVHDDLETGGENRATTEAGKISAGELGQG